MPSRDHDGLAAPNERSAAGALTRLLRQLLFQVEPLDPWTFGVTALVLLVVATVASYLPGAAARLATTELLASGTTAVLTMETVHDTDVVFETEIGTSPHPDSFHDLAGRLI